MVNLCVRVLPVLTQPTAELVHVTVKLVIVIA